MKTSLLFLLAVLLMISGCSSPPPYGQFGDPLPADVGLVEKGRVTTLLAELAKEVNTHPRSAKALSDLQAQYAAESQTSEGLRRFSNSLATKRAYVSVLSAANSKKVEQLLNQLEEAALSHYLYCEKWEASYRPTRRYD